MISKNNTKEKDGPLLTKLDLLSKATYLVYYCSMRIMRCRISDRCVVSLQITGFSLTHHSKCLFLCKEPKVKNTALYSV